MDPLQKEQDFFASSSNVAMEYRKPTADAFNKAKVWFFYHIFYAN